MGNIIGKIWEEITGPVREGEEKWALRKALQELLEERETQTGITELRPNKEEERLARAENRLKRAKNKVEKTAIKLENSEVTLELKESQLELEESQNEVKLKLQEVALKAELLNWIDKEYVANEKTVLKILRLKAYAERYQIQWKLDNGILEKSQARLERAKNRLKRAENQLETEESKLEVLEIQLESLYSCWIILEIVLEEKWRNRCTKVLAGDTNTRGALSLYSWRLDISDYAEYVKSISLTENEILEFSVSKNKCEEESVGSKSAEYKDLPNPRIKKVKEVNLREEQYKLRA